MRRATPIVLTDDERGQLTTLARIRIAQHLAYRAAAIGVPETPGDVFDARDYELSSTCRYVAALGDEPAKIAAEPIATISQVPPPAAFVALWQADVRAWKSRHEITDAPVTTLAACGRRIHTPRWRMMRTTMQKGMESDVEGTA